MFLEDWIHNKIKQQVEEDIEYRRYIGKDNLTAVTRQDVEDFQLFRLRKTLTYACEKSPFYQNLFAKSGVDPTSVQSLSDLARLPFTQSTNLAEEPYKFLCISLGEIARAFTMTTSGTTGAVKKVFFIGEDIEIISDCMAALLKTALLDEGLTPSKCTVQIFLPNGTPMSQANLLAKGVEKLGGLPVSTDITLSTKEQIEAIARSRPTVLVGSAFRIHRITQEARQSCDIGNWGVKVVVITSEYLSKAMRENLEGYWNAKIYQHYGMTEMGLSIAIECQAHNGLHFNEADFLIEVVDPKTGEVLTNGSEGELVFTTISRQGMPLIRYKSGDLARVTYQPCHCGASTPRIATINKRAGAIVRIGEGQEIYPSLFDDVLYEIPELVDYRVLLIKEQKKECLICRAELLTESTGAQERLLNALLNVPAIRKGIENNLLDQPQIQLVGLGTLRREERAKQRIIDNR